MSALPKPNSYRLHVADDHGGVFLWSCGDLNGLGAAKKHARWWIGWRKRPAAYKDRTRDGRMIPSPIGKARVVVELYYDKSAERD